MSTTDDAAQDPVDQDQGAPTDGLTVGDNVSWVMRGPDGEVKSEGTAHNLITQVGAQVFTERGWGVAGAGAVPIGMKLGTGSTAPSATGAGAALVTYLSGSNALFAATWPQSSLQGSSRQIQFKCSYAAGTATTATAITEAVLFNDANANATSTAANTLGRVIISPGSKAAADSLDVFWNVQVLPS